MSSLVQTDVKGIVKSFPRSLIDEKVPSSEKTIPIQD